jgi:hypothetical protein
MEPIETVYYGETPCQACKKGGKQCTNKAYYLLDDQYVCGVHSLKYVDERETLPKNPHKGEIQQAQLVLHNKTVEAAREPGKKGTVSCYHMGMMKKVELKPGYLNIFPNFKYGGRKDGLGMPELSPKKMGPVNHCQPGLPPAMNLENLFQGSKCYPSECDETGNPNQKFYETQKAMFTDPIPHRHKDASGHKNVPVYSVWITKEGKELHLDYITSRQIYCHYYENFANTSTEFHKLRQLITDGYNLRICGYDAYQPTKTLNEHYLDSSRPFGHELVLYTMLTEDPKNYPWLLHQTLTF